MGKKAALTKTQKAVLEAIEALRTEGVPPTYDGLAERLGMSSRSSISANLVSLRKKGWIDFGRKVTSIEIMEDGGWIEAEASSPHRLRGVIEEAAEALAAQIGRTKAADVLALILVDQRTRAKAERQRKRDQAKTWRKAG